MVWVLPAVVRQCARMAVALREGATVPDNVPMRMGITVAGASIGRGVWGWMACQMVANVASSCKE